MQHAKGDDLGRPILGQCRDDASTPAASPADDSRTAWATATATCQGTVATWAMQRSQGGPLSFGPANVARRAQGRARRRQRPAGVITTALLGLILARRGSR
jgi:hypothetical protein